jgi:acyl-CoA dehydrogenase
LIDFRLTERQRELAERVEAFIEKDIIPYERDPRVGPHGPSEDLRRELNALAREQGLLAPQAPEAWGGLGLSHVDMAVAFEASGRSPLGPVAMHCAAPDEGNMNLLAKVASEEQKQRWLLPLVKGEIRSCFCLTEPMGAGADPNQLRTTAAIDGDCFVVSGRKWLITGAAGAGFAIIMADVPEVGGQPGGATMLISDMDQPGIRPLREIDSIDTSFTGGHGDLLFEDLRIPRDQVLGEVGQGFRYVQVRLAPARLTHCMRWLGGAARAHGIALDYARRRHAFGRAIGEHEGVGFMLADNEIDLHQSRLAIWHTAWLLDRGEHARHESSMVKTSVSEALFRVADRCVQVLGGLGVTRDTVVEQVFREIRAFRIYDGPSEVHRFAIARRILRGGGGGGRPS